MEDYSRYTPQYIDAWKQLGAGLAFDVWDRVAGSKLAQFSEPRARFRPVPVSVKLQGTTASPAGAVRLEVPTWDPDWYRSLCKGIAQMLRLPEGVAATMELRDMTGAPVSAMSMRELGRAGELDVFLRGKLKRVAQLPEPPREISTQKLRHIHDWADGLCAAAADVAAERLARCSMAELEAECAPNGPLFKALHKEVRRPRARQLDDGRPWDEFARSHALDSQGAAPDVVAESVARALLAAVRRGLRASEGELRAAYAARSIQKGTPDEGGALFAAPKGASAGRLRNMRQLYGEIAQDALCAPTLAPRVAELVYRHPQIGERKRETPFSDKQPTLVENHKRWRKRRHWKRGWYRPYRPGLLPWLFGTTPYYPPPYPYPYVYGKLPEGEPSYEGDAPLAHSMHSVYAGRHPLPSIGDEMEPEDEDENEGEEEEISDKMPPLVPLGEPACEIGCGCGRHKKDKKKRIEGEMPPLVPLKSTKEEMPPLVPLEAMFSDKDEEISDEMPPLVPLEALFGRESTNRRPRAVPLPAHQEPVEGALFREPTLDDFL